MGLSFLAPFRGQIHAVTRIVLGFLFLCHGLQKLFGMFGGSQGPMSDPMRITAGGIELVGGLMMLVGFRAAWAAFICSGMMAVGYFMAHQKMGALPIQNHGELAAVYSFVFLYFAAHGSGPWSVDQRLAGKAG